MNTENHNKQLNEQQALNVFQCLPKAQQRALIVELQEKISGTEQPTVTVATVIGCSLD